MEKDKHILLTHGSGGKQTHNLIETLFKKYFSNEILDRGDDSAVIPLSSLSGSLAFTTDSFTVTPIFFQGGNIGDLAVNGTVNDLLSVGANPLYLSIGFILEEGLLMTELEEIVKSISECCKKANVKIVTGDTKVVNRGQCDKIFINTSGIGIIPSNINLSGRNAKDGDAIIINGTIGDHGITILSQREGLTFKSNLKSDTQSLHRIVKAVLDKYPNDVRVLRDPTRGGVATTLNEIAQQSNIGIRLFEDEIPISEEVRALCEILGLDVMHIANEGKMLFICSQSIANDVVSILKGFPEGQNASIIGEVTSKYQGRVILKTSIGGERFLDMLYGEALPRIC